MNRFNFLVTTISVAVILFSSCKDEVVNIEDFGIQPEQVAQQRQTDEIIVLGDKIDDPYSVKNMKIAYSNLKSSSDIPEVNVEPTHNYLRFLPKDEDELDLLKSDSSIMIFDFPLDYEIVNNGTHYHDPNIPDEMITWQYAVLPIDYNLPDIEHELLYQVVLPYDDDGIERKNNSTIFDLIEKESFKITGNLDEEETNNISQKGLLKRYRPSGRITVKESISGNQFPLRGAKVQARWTTHIGVGITNDNGEFEVDARFLYKVNFGIKWERADYDIRNGKLLQAWYNESGKATRWYLDITGGKSLHFAHIHVAAHHFFYENPFGLTKPSGIPNKLKISYLDSNGTGMSRTAFMSLTGLSNIFIWGYNTIGVYKESNYIFGTTLHELGHISHSNYNLNHYRRGADWIAESWATAVEWQYTNNYYSQYYNNTSYNHENGTQTWTTGGYTPIFIDLIDDYNQSNSWSGYPDDDINSSHGYTLYYIERNILTKATNLTTLKNVLYSKKPLTSVTNMLIDDLLALYQNANLNVN